MKEKENSATKTVAASKSILGVEYRKNLETFFERQAMVNGKISFYHYYCYYWIFFKIWKCVRMSVCKSSYKNISYILF